MSGRTRVGLVFGGRSVEHAVSVLSARAVAEALEQTDLDWFPIGVTGDGRWLSPERSRSILEAGQDRVESGPDRDDDSGLVIDPGGQRLLQLEPGASPRPVGVDVIFPLIHGWGGEDGRLQGALETASIPYVGAGVLGSALAMDKAVAKEILAAHRIPVVEWRCFDRASYEREPGRVEASIGSDVGFPAFVKPSNGGSSVGISRVESADGLREALDEAFACDRKVVAERAVDAREIECAVMGNDVPEPSVLGEIVPKRRFYDYAAKYLDDSSELKIPAELPVDLTRAIRQYAVAGFLALDLEGFARVDFLVDRGTGRVFLNEANTLPGFTPISMFPKLWEASGLAYPRQIERLVELALERRTAQSRRRTVWNER